MSLRETLWIGFDVPDSRYPSLETILVHHASIREAIAATGYVVPTELNLFVSNAAFVYATNIYKSIGLLLPHLYHESGAVVLRQLWEVSINLHWIERDSLKRTEEFCNFSVMEYRKMIKKLGDATAIKSFDDTTASFQKEFFGRTKRGQKREYHNFAKTSVRDRAVDLGEPWKTEYDLIYQLSSMHAHGAPGAILNGIFRQHGKNFQKREENSAAMIAILAIKFIVRNVRLLEKMNLIPDPSKVYDKFESFQQILTTNDC